MGDEDWGVSNDGWGNDSGQSNQNRRQYTGRTFNNSNRNRNEGNWRNNDSKRDNGWGDRPQRRQQNNYEKGDELTMDVPSDKIGKIIGRGGNKIKEMQQESDTNIKVLRNESHDDITRVLVCGKADAIEKAKKLIEDLILSDNTRNYGSNRSDSNQNQCWGSNNSTTGWGSNENYRETSNTENSSWGNGAETSSWGNAGKKSSWGNAAEKSSWTNAAEKSDWSQESTNQKDDSQEIDWQAVLKEGEKASQAYWATLPPIVKNFYKEKAHIASMPAEQVARIRAENNNITVKYVFNDLEHTMDIPNPIVDFDDCFSDYPEIMEAIQNQEFDKPSPIQSQAWPILLRGQDLIGIAQTGTGKTLAFLLPAFIHIEGQLVPREERLGPTVLVLAPTRELAQQIEKEVQKYSYRGIKSVCIYGGGSRREQAETIKRGVEIVIATPGRLSDLNSSEKLNLDSVSYVVLDEADRMLDLGFEPQIRKILFSLRPKRQTVLTSATWPPTIRDLAKSYTEDPVQITVGSLDLAAVHTVQQHVQIVEDNDEVKYNELVEFIQNMDQESKAIIFCGKKSRVNHLTSELALIGVNAASMHGDLDQADREQALQDLKDGTIQLLIATDVASRGIDVSDITHVINYDFPRNIEEYVHRVGRTGRAGKTGESLSFITRSDWRNAKELISILEEANQNVPDELYSMSERFEKFQEKKQQERSNFRSYKQNHRY